MFNETMSWSQVGNPRDWSDLMWVETEAEFKSNIGSPGKWGYIKECRFIEKETQPLSIKGLKGLFGILKRKMYNG